MSERKYSIDNDLKEAQRMIEALEPYVYQDQLYMPISGGGIFSPMPALTIGAVLLRLRRLDALRGPMTDNQQTTLDALLDQNRKVWNEWRVHYEKKLAEEANSRLKLLWISCGTADDLLGVNRDFKDWLRSRKVAFYEEEAAGIGHVWPLWRQDFANFAERAFK